MIGLLMRAAGLATIYLLVMTSAHPWDVAAGAALGLAIAAGLRPRRSETASPAASARGVAALLGSTALEVVRGSWRTVGFCLGAPATPGLVEVPRGDRTRVEVGLWGVLTGEAPDEVPIDVDEERGILLVHVVDATDPEAVRERHRRAHERLRGREPR